MRVPSDKSAESSETGQFSWLTRETAFNAVIIVLIFTALHFTATQNYLLFHTIAEVCSIIIACSVFLLVWNGRAYIEDRYLLLLGIAYFFVACIDLAHTFSYRGMGFFPNELNSATQLWISARYLQSLSILATFFFIGRKLDVYLVFIVYAAISFLLMFSILYWRIFPDCYLEGLGLTTFKIVSEYIISLILALAILLFYLKRRLLDEDVLRLLIASFVFTILSELAFTKYISVFSLSNQIGHFLKLMAFFLVYKAIIEIGLVRPHTLLFKNLKEREEMFRETAERLEKEVQERIAVRRQLEKSHITLNQIFNGTADSIRVVGTDRSILRVNGSFLESVGLDEDQVYSLKCHELFYGSECFTEYCTLTRLQQGEEEVDCEMIKTDQNGRDHLVQMIAKPYHDVNGEFLGIIESYKDISRRKEMERIIREERDLFIEGFVVIFKWRNRSGWPVEYVSPNVQRVLGYSVQQVTAKNFRYTDIIDPQDQNRVIQKKMQAARSGEEHEEHEPYRIRDTDGNIRWIMDHTRFVKNEQGDVDYFYGYLLDVSNYKATEERLENQVKLAHAGRLTSLGEMASGMAHELNQPLTVIRLSADGLKSAYAMASRDKAEEEAVDDIISQVKRAAKIIKNMRAFSRADSSGYQSVSLSEPVENAVSFFREQFRTHEITLNLDMVPDMPNVMLDPQKFEQIVVNFLSNARYAVETKKEYAGSDYKMAVTVRTRVNDEQTQVIFEVEDNGISMTPEVADRCLEPFFTQKDIGEGTGLGLSIVSNIAREFGMTLDINRLDGNGCLFRVSIPVHTESW